MTAQIRDVLHYQGKQLSLFSYPLESLFDDDHPRPAFVFSSTANYRGYIATWTMEDDVLYVTDLQGWIARKEVGLEFVFPDATGPVKASWFRGRLRIFLGEQPEYFPVEDGSIYERNQFLEFHQGHLIFEELIEARSDKIIQSRLTRQGVSLFGPEEWAFIEAIRANLKDSVSRQVYADWLEEQGDGRAELLRLENQLRQPKSESETASLWDRMEGLYAEQARKGNTLGLWMSLVAMPRRPRRMPSAGIGLLHP